MQAVSKGVWLCIFSQSLFGIMYLFSAWMLPLTGTDVFVLRMIGSLFAILAILLPIMGLSDLKTFIRNELGVSWKRWLTFLMGSALAGSQFWLFMWAPVNGEGVNVAVGYFLFPLVMAFGGYLWFKERLTLLQKMALFLAALGVAHELWTTQTFSWTSLWVCLGYPPYYLSRRAMKTPALQGLTLDIIFISIPCFIYLAFQPNVTDLLVSDSRYWLFVPLLGLISAVSVTANLKSGLLLPVSLFSMMSYLEPSLLFLFAIWFLHTPVNESAYLTYFFIWSGLLLLMLNSLYHWRFSSCKTLHTKTV